MDRKYNNPIPTVDIIIIMGKDIEFVEQKVVLIYRKNPPYGWALPGGFVDYGESLENAAVREAYEETSLRVDLVRQFHTYSDPQRDSRQHTITTVFIARGNGQPKGMDDARRAKIFPLFDLPNDMAFDHALIFEDYRKNRY